MTTMTTTKRATALPDGLQGLGLCLIRHTCTNLEDSLVSVALGVVLVEGNDLCTALDVPEFSLDGDTEKAINLHAGNQDLLAWPGWDAIFSYMAANPSRWQNFQPSVVKFTQLIADIALKADEYYRDFSGAKMSKDEFKGLQILLRDYFEHIGKEAKGEQAPH